MTTPIQTNGIIIKEYNYDEADKIFVIFTADRGKITCFAKGVRKGKSKMRGFLQLFSYSKLHLHKGKSMYTVIGGEVINSFPGVKNDLLLFSYANYITEILEGILLAEEKNKAVFTTTISMFHLMESIPVSQLSSYYLLRIIKYAGFLPELSICVLCGEKIEANAWFSNLEGGCVCIECGKELDNKGYMPLNIIRIMEQLLTMDVNMLSRLKIKEKDQFFIEDLLCEYLKYILEKPINSINFVREIRGA